MKIILTKDNVKFRIKDKWIQYEIPMNGRAFSIEFDSRYMTYSSRLYL